MKYRKRPTLINRKKKYIICNKKQAYKEIQKRLKFWTHLCFKNKNTCSLPLQKRCDKSFSSKTAMHWRTPLVQMSIGDVDCFPSGSLSALVKFMYNNRFWLKDYIINGRFSFKNHPDIYVYRAAVTDVNTYTQTYVCMCIICTHTCIYSQKIPATLLFFLHSRITIIFKCFIYLKCL